MSILGRDVKYGVGIGADAAASSWLNQLEFNLKPVSQYASNNSAWGNVVKTNSSTVLRNWSEGNLSHKLTADSAGTILLGAFGSVVTSDNADSNAAVKNHTFNISNDIDGQVLTFYRKDNLSTEKYTSARIGEWQLSVELDDYIKFSADILAKKGVATTASPAPVEQTEFVAKHFTLKTAANAAALGAATNQSKVSSFTLTVNPNLEADNEAGSDEPYGFTSRGYDLSFEMTCRYTDTSFRDAYQNGTTLAMQTSIVNSGVTIGAAANPGLVFTAPRINITDWDRTGDLDAPLVQTMTGTIHYSPSDLYALRAVLTNTVASYA